MNVRLEDVAGKRQHLPVLAGRLADRIITDLFDKNLIRRYAF